VRWCTPLVVDEIDHGLVVVRQPLVFADVATGEVITVVAGFVSDGTSRPAPPRWPRWARRFLAWLVTRVIGHALTPRYLPAAILHDYEIATRDASWWRVHTRFGRALRASGVAPWRAAIMAALVTAFGPKW
jgi:hypothetical protein